MNNIIIGETCLLDKQLRRLGIIDSAHGCFDDILINLDGITEIIKDDFNHILDSEFLISKYYNYYPDHNISYDKLINLKYSIDNDNIYSWNVMSFFHIHNANDIDTMKRRIERTKNWFHDSNDTILYYYYRYSDRYNTSKHYKKLIQFQNILNSKFDKRFKILNITNYPSSDSIISENIMSNILSVNFSSENSWIDINDNWDAHLDNTLFDQFFNSLLFKEFKSFK